MRTIALSSSIAAVTFLAAAPLPAQDRFGQAVGIHGPHVVALKPTNSRGPATVYLFGASSSGEWQVLDTFYPRNAGTTGEGFGRSMAVAGGEVLVASGDPKNVYGATALSVSPEATWLPGGRLPLVDPDSVVQGELDLAGIMSILQPPRRLVASDGSRALVAVRSGRGARVLVFARQADGSWVEEGVVAPAEGEPHRSFGSTLAIAGDRLLVGSPSEDRIGAVFLFIHDADGAWRETARLVPDELERGTNFGTALAFDGSRIVVGSSGSRRVIGDVRVFEESEATGRWHEVARVSHPDSTSGDGFGGVLALGDNELWVGAPRADENTGRVYRFTRTGGDEAWTAAGTLAASGIEEGFRFGSSLALSSDLGVVGAPGAVGNAGRVGVYRPGEAGWSGPVWLDDGLTLDMVAEETRCDEGQAGQFLCDNVDLVAFLPTQALGGEPGEGVSDLWGWTDPETGREYVLLGRTGGAAFVDISDPSTPVYLGAVAANRSGARDLKVYRDHLFFTGDGAGDHGLIVFDLTRLRDVTDPPVAFEPDAVYTEIASAHNLILDPDAGFAYPVGSSGGGVTCGGGLHMVDIRDPLNPTFAGCYTDTEGLLYEGRTHDGQCVVYRGPDEDYRERQICFASNETALRIVDVTDKENPEPIAAVSYPGRAYIHQGWLTDDQRYFYLNDELDELVGTTDRTRTLILDVADLDDPVVVSEYRGTTPATDHNLYVKGDRMYQANYQAGLQIIDISDRENPVQVGHFDTTPYDGGNPPGFSGAWTAYPFFESGLVVVSSRAEGLFIVKPRPPELVP